MNQRVFSVSVPADPRYLKAIRAFFQSVLADVCGERADMVILAVDEACSNVMKYRSGGCEDNRIRLGAEFPYRRSLSLIYDRFLRCRTRPIKSRPTTREAHVCGEGKGVIG